MGKIRKWFHNMSVRTAFVVYALLTLIIAVLLCSFIINWLDNERVRLYFKYKYLSEVYEVPEGGSAQADYNYNEVYYTVYDADGNIVTTFSANNSTDKITLFYNEDETSIKSISVGPQYTDEDKAVEVAIGIMQTITIPVVFIGGMILCAIIFYRKKLKKPINLLTDSYIKVAENNLDFALAYDCKDEMGQLCSAFEKMRRALRANNKELWRQMEERKRLNAAFSHDLRTPLTVLKGHASMLLTAVPEGTVTNEEIIGEVRTMSAHITRLENYVNAMTRLQRLEDIEIRPAVISSENFVRNLIETAEIVCGNKTLIFHTETGAASISADEEIISQVFENVLSNASRYARKRIEITFRVAEGYFSIRVADDGPGFSQNDLDKASNPFYRADKENDGSHMGIGLNICKILCEKHGGYISLSNAAEGGGAIVVFFAI